jgi:predicted site-specific integrase-resolvase
MSFRKIMLNDKTHSNPGAAVISLSKWMENVGVSPCTVWRWRKKGWLKTINIAGRQYLTQESIDEFHRRAVSGEFAQIHKVPRARAD